MFEVLGNIYGRSIVIVFGTVFEDCGNLFFDKNFLKILYFCFLFIQKTTELALEKLP